ncbi:MAG: hypothetical protein WCO42_08185 [bacterium]
MKTVLPVGSAFPKMVPGFPTDPVACFPHEQPNIIVPLGVEHEVPMIRHDHEGSHMNFPVIGIPSESL